MQKFPLRGKSSDPSRKCSDENVSSDEPAEEIKKVEVKAAAEPLATICAGLDFGDSLQMKLDEPIEVDKSEEKSTDITFVPTHASTRVSVDDGCSDCSSDGGEFFEVDGIELSAIEAAALHHRHNLTLEVWAHWCVLAQESLERKQKQM
mmetsp:Transcript_118056/g.235182  ORF Transcript_118056/g.235182 Transcript_118056/m.235182 type:complete len:149 (+) Transcript_118056:87-533(+)